MVRRVCDRSFNAKSMEEFDEMEVIRGSELQENEDQATLRMLRGGYTRLARTTADLSVKVDSMETKMDTMQRTLLQISNQLGIHPIAAETSRQTPPVTYSDPYVHDDLNRLPLDNRKSLMPEFDGSNASEWLSKVERFFSVRRYSDLTKLDLVAFSLEGDVLLWFDREMTRREFQSWDEFRRRLLLQFGAAPENSSENVAEILEERASHTEKKGTVSASVTESAELSSQVIGLDESHLEQLLSRGLQTEMKEVLQLQEPMGLENQTPAVLRMGTFTSKPVASVNFLSFEVGTADNLFSGLSQTSQVWEPGGVQVLPNQAKILKDGNVITFGTGSSTYRLSAIPLVFYFCPFSETFKMDQSVHAASSSSGAQISPALSEECNHVLLEPQKRICSEIPGYSQYRPSVMVGEALLDVVTKPVTECTTTEAIFQRVLARTVSHEWHRWKHKSAYLLYTDDRVIAADLGRQAVLEQITKGVRHAWLQRVFQKLAAPLYERFEILIKRIQPAVYQLHSGFDGEKLTRKDFHLSETHSQEQVRVEMLMQAKSSTGDFKLPLHHVPDNGLLVFPWNLMLLEFFLFIHLEDKVCLSGASNRWCGWQVFDRGKNNIISGDVITLVFLDLKKCFFQVAEIRKLSLYKVENQNYVNSREDSTLELQVVATRDVPLFTEMKSLFITVMMLKLAAKYFGPFQVVERIGVVVFKDQPLPREIAAVLDSFAPAFVIVILVVVDRLSKAVHVLGLKHPFKPGWEIGVHQQGVLD